MKDENRENEGENKWNKCEFKKLEIKNKFGKRELQGRMLNGRAEKREKME
jgi:hypothetical protein